MSVQRTWGSRTLSIQEPESLGWLEFRVKEKVKRDEADEEGKLARPCSPYQGFGIF